MRSKQRLTLGTVVIALDYITGLPIHTGAIVGAKVTVPKTKAPSYRQYRISGIEGWFSEHSIKKTTLRVVS